MGFNMTPWTILLACLVGTQVRSTSALLEPNIPEDGLLNFTQITQKYYQPCEQYEVTTEDGYILTLFRLRGSNQTVSAPVLLWHGILDSSDIFVVRGENSTGISLAKAGYDVWFGNSRGNKYSTRHQTLDPEKDKAKFWDFSFHEFGYYDLPSTIDFIIETTGHEKISAIGHSQGSSLFYILGSLRPEYNEKIEIAISMAPVAYLNHLRGLLAVIAPFWPAVTVSLALTGTEGIFQDQSSMNKLLQLICSQGELAEILCEDGAVMGISGDDSEELEPEFFRVMLGHYPAGSARKNGDHYYQVVSRKRFGQFDYGLVKNLAVYGSDTPPDYDLGKVTMPMIILAAENDNFSTLEDVEDVKKDLGNVVYYKVMDRKQFNHIDYVIGKNINVYINPLLQSLLEQYGNPVNHSNTIN